MLGNYSQLDNISEKIDSDICEERMQVKAKEDGISLKLFIW